MKRALLLLALVVACQAGPAPAPAASPPPAGVRGGTLAIGDYEYPDTLDPVHAGTAAGLRVANLLFLPLWTFGPDLKPVPRLLREVPTVANGDVRAGSGGTMTVDLKLRPGLRWSDGAPLTAADLVFGADAVCGPGLPGRDRDGFDRLQAQVQRSATEVVWHFGPRPAGACGLPAPLASGLYPAWLTMGPRAFALPVHRLASVPEAQWPASPFFSAPDAVSGPFEPAGGVPGRLLQLVANPHYADGRAAGPWLDGVTFRAFDGKAALIAGLQSGEVQLGFHLEATDAPQLAAIAGSRTLTTPTLRGELLVPRLGAAPWAGDPALLPAIAAGIDRQALVRAAFAGAAEPAIGPFPPPLPGSTVPAAAPGQGAAAARSALDADGWTPGAGGVRARAGRQLRFTLDIPCDDDVRALEAAELARQWAALGAAVSTACRPRSVLLAAGGPLAQGQFQLALLSIDWRPDPSAWSVLASGPLDWSGCSDAALDSALAAGAASLDANARLRAYRAAAARWAAAGCAIPLLQWPEVTQAPDALHGFQPSPLAGLDTWNAADWWLR